MRLGLSLPASRAALAAALEGLVRVNETMLARRRFPPLYMSGVRYRREPRGGEDWQTADRVLARMAGDCEDLAAWRAAELRVYGGEHAIATVKRTGPRMWHAVVLRADGSIDDPSRALGMGARRRAR